MRTRRPSITAALLVLSLASLCPAQTKPAGDDRAQVIAATHAFIHSLRGLDKASVLKLYAPTKTATEARAVQDVVWLAIELQRLRMAAETKLGPVPMDEDDQWNWGVISQAQFDAQLAKEPPIVTTDGNHATVFLSGGLKLEKQTNGAWMFVESSDDNEGLIVPSDGKARSAMEDKFKAILSDIETGKIATPSDVPNRVMEVLQTR